jgi:hypothetical protein
MIQENFTMNNDNYNNLTSRRASYVDAIREHAPALGIDITKDHYSRAELRQVSMAWKSKIWIPNWITHDQSRRMGRGMFSIPEVPIIVANEDAETSIEATAVTEELVTV